MHAEFVLEESCVMEGAPQSPQKGHTRSRSATVLKSIISPNKRSLPQKKSSERLDKKPADNTGYFGLPVLGEIDNQGGKSPKKSTRATKKQPSEFNPWTEPDTPLSPAESVLLSPSRSFAPKDKENTTPPRIGNSEPYTPIWAEFSTQSVQDAKRSGGQTGRGSNSPRRPPEPSPTRSPRKPSHTSQSTQPHSSVHQSTAMNNSGPINRDSPKKSSRVLSAMAKFDNRGRQAQEAPVEEKLDGKDFDEAFEQVLAARNIPENRRVQMRSLDAKIKRDFIKNEGRLGTSIENNDPELSSHESQASSKQSKRCRGEQSQVTSSSQYNDTEQRSGEDQNSPSKRRSRSRSRTFTFTKRDQSKKSRSQSRPRSLMSLKNLSSSSINSIGLDGSNESKEGRRRAEPEEFVDFLKGAKEPEKVEVGRLQKLRRILRHESVTWVDEFICDGGMDAVIGLLRSIMKVEWREEHEDMLLHEALLCLKGLCNTERALTKLNDLQDPLFQELLNMLFDEERRGPAEYGTRSIITFLLFTHLSSAKPGHPEGRARAILSCLADPTKSDNDQPAEFITKMAKPRPYQRWCKEVTNVTKEVFWIFLHHLNAVPTSSAEMLSSNEPYFSRHFPRERPPVPAAPYVGGVEWEATNYIASHLDLMNGIIASIPTMFERLRLREELRASGFEQLMGATLRLCKEKFYGAVHDGLRTWVDAASEDGWDTLDVRQGPPRRTQQSVPASPTKSKEPPPKLDLRLDFGDQGKQENEKKTLDEGWQL